MIALVTLHRNTDRLSAGFHRFEWAESVDGVEIQRREVAPNTWQSLGFGSYEEHARAVVASIAATYGATACYDGYGVGHAMFNR